MLDAVVIKSSVHSDRWVIWTNANGVPYEQNLDFLLNYSDKLTVNILTFNYRGVGQSSG